MTDAKGGGGKVGIGTSSWSNKERPLHSLDLANGLSLCEDAKRTLQRFLWASLVPFFYSGRPLADVSTAPRLSGCTYLSSLLLGRLFSPEDII